MRASPLAAALCALFLAACSGSNYGVHVTPAPTVPPNQELYIGNSPSLLGPSPDETPSVTVYPLGSNGNVTPTRALAASATSQISTTDVLTGLAVDGTGRLYVSSIDAYQISQIALYPMGANGAAAPVTTMQPLSIVQDVALDPRGWLYALGLAEVVGIPAGSSMPSYTLNANVGLNGFAIDGSGNLYTLAEGVVSVYPQGQTTASRSVQMSVDVNVPDAIAVDLAGNLYVGADGTIDVFAPGAQGNASPIRVISGSNTTLSAISAMTLDSAGNLYVADVVADEIAVFAPGANGNVSPKRTISGKATGINFPSSLAIGP